MMNLRFLDSGDAGLVVEFGNTVDPEINDRVLALDRGLASRALPGIVETVPTYRSLMIQYDPLVLTRENLILAIHSVQPGSGSATAPRNLWTIPCCYEDDFGDDLKQVAASLGIDEARVVELHSKATFRVYMYGFAPGFCYLGGLPKELHISRRPTPRAPHAPNAILMAGGLSLIGTFPMPTGWWVIGRTPVRMYSPWREKNFFAEAGDLVKFDPIDKEQFASLEQRAFDGELIAHCEKRS